MLGLGGEHSDGLGASEFVLSCVGEEGGEVDTPPVSHPPIRGQVVLEEPDQVGLRHAQHVGGLLGGEFCAHSIRFASTERSHVLPGRVVEQGRFVSCVDVQNLRSGM